MNRPLISVIIPTYQDWERLTNCLKALLRQSLDVNDFEVIVVNNDPNEIFPVSVAQIPLKLKLLTESKPGSYAARNEGLYHAEADILAFTDSDCTPDPNWLTEGVKRMQNTDFHRVTGPVKLFYSTPKPNAFDHFEMLYGFKQIDNVNHGSSVTANLFVKKELFDIVGLFNEKMKSGGDNEWNLRASKLGYSIGYFPEIIVYHPTRSNYRELRQKAKRIAGGKFVLIKSDRKAAIKMFLRGLIPSLQDWKFLQIEATQASYPVRIQIYFIKYLLNVERSMEILQLLFGKEDQRK